MLDLWYKNAVVYCLDVDSFMDENGDGVGDFAGLRNRLAHIEDLGATCVWLLPFYPTPDRDNGYDIIDYYGVDPRLGTLGDFVAFTQAAEDHGLRVLVDLVVNHTSIQHPWFQEARDPRSPRHDWYIWSETKPEDAEEKVVFPGVQESTWTWDARAGRYYFHRFYRHQADLNIANPAVREEIERIMGFWLALGVSGFRIDAVPFLLEDVEGSEHAGWQPFAYLDELNRFLSWRRSEAVLLAEANIPLDKAPDYFGDGDRLQVVFNFVLNQQLFLALARGEAGPVERTLRALPEVGSSSQWATFLRNHDELDLGRLSDAERRTVFAAMGPDPVMQIYERGIRRRLAPMLGGDPRRIKMALSLMLALPGTPVLWYGDEIGMGDDLALPERNAVRTPMQWSPDGASGGFSRQGPEQCVRPPVAEGPFRFQLVNVASQRFRRDSLFETVQRLVRLRRSLPEVGWGPCEPVATGTPGVLGMRSRWGPNDLLTLHNLTACEQRARLPSEVGAAVRETMMASDEASGSGFRLEPYGFRWLRLRAP